MGFEPMTYRLQGGYSTPELHGLIVDFSTNYLIAHSLSPFLTKFQQSSNKVPTKFQQSSNKVLTLFYPRKN